MDIHAVPPTLRDRLGDDATGDLLHLLDLVDHERREDLITACTDRFERRLVEEAAGLRVLIGHVDSSIRQDMTLLGAGLRQEMTQLGAELRQEMTQLGSELRQEMTQLGSELRQEMTQLGAELRQEMTQLGSELRQEMASMRDDLLRQMAADRFESLKWAFLFWIGQVVAIGTLFGVMLRLGRAG